MRGWLSLTIVYVVWGSTYLGIRVADRQLPGLLLAGMRFFVVGAIALPLALLAGGAAPRRADPLDARAWGASALVGVLLIACGNGGVTVAVHYLPAGLSAVVVSVVPLWMALLGGPILHQRIGAAAALGLAVGLGGVGLLAGTAAGGGHLAAIVLTVAASFCWALGTVWGTRLPVPSRTIVAMAAQMLVGGTLLMAVSASDGQLEHVDWSRLSAETWESFAFLVVVGTTIGFAAYGDALKRLPITTVATYAYVNPVVAVVLGAWLLHEHVSGTEVIGAALVVLSVVLAVRRPRLLGGRSKGPAPPELPGGETVRGSALGSP